MTIKIKKKTTGSGGALRGKAKPSLPPKRRPGSRAHLTKKRVIETALQLSQEAPDLSIPMIARALDVYPTAVYSHCPGGMAEIRSAMVQALLADIAPPLKPNESGRDYLCDLFRRIGDRLQNYSALARHVVSELSADPLINPRLPERILTAFEAAGLPEPERLAAYERFMMSLIGYISVYFSDAPGQVKKLKADLDALEAGEFPMVSQVSEDLIALVVQRRDRLKGDAPSVPHVDATAEWATRGLGLPLES